MQQLVDNSDWHDNLPVEAWKQFDLAIEGQPKTAAHLLFTKLRAANFRLLYHGDFDWSGIRIGT